jgi:hypothetical protein
MPSLRECLLGTGTMQLTSLRGPFLPPRFLHPESVHSRYSLRIWPWNFPGPELALGVLRKKTRCMEVASVPCLFTPMKGLMVWLP